MLKKQTLIFIFAFALAALNLNCTQATSLDQGTAPDFSLLSLENEEVTLSQFRGKEAVMLVFGATWCPYCVEEIPELKEIYNNYKDKGLRILYIDIQESREKVESFAKSRSIPYTVLLDASGEVANAYGVRGIPHQAVINKDGTIYYQGPRPYEGLKALISKLMGE